MEVSERSISEEDIQENLRLIRGIDQFQRFTDDELISVIMNMKIADVPQGEIICLEGEIGNEMYIIRHGDVEIRKAGKVSHLVLTTLSKGDIFGEMSLLDGSPRSASAIARTDSGIIIISKEGIDDLSLVDEHLACNFLIEVIKAACDKIRESRQNLISVLGPLLSKK